MRGALSRHFVSIRVSQRSRGSMICESAESNRLVYSATAISLSVIFLSSRSQLSSPLSLDQFDHRAIWILAADEALLLAIRQIHDNRFGPELDPLSLERFIILAQRFRAQCDSRHPRMEQIRVGGPDRLGVFPLDQIKARGARIIAEHHQRRT